MFSIIVVLLFFTSLIFLCLELVVNMWFIASYLLLSLTTFICFGIDKRNAIRGQWRVSEKTLHLWSVIGGWPGALLAQRMFRHKTKKRSFIVMLWLGILTNLAVFSYYISLTKILN